MIPDTFDLELCDGASVCVRASIEALTTYALLEQEDWFEKEATFVRRWLRPGMTVIDVGANVGVYTAMFAKCVGSGGRVFAYEPAAVAFELLGKTRRLNDGADWITVRQVALSDRRGSAFLAHGKYAELHALVNRENSQRAGETVTTSTLDAEAEEHSWAPPDLIKLDAEGSDARVAAGARGSLVSHSPLVMFEVRRGDVLNHRLLGFLREANYEIYRSLPG